MRRGDPSRWSRAGYWWRPSRRRVRRTRRSSAADVRRPGTRPARERSRPFGAALACQPWSAGYDRPATTRWPDRGSRSGAEHPSVVTHLRSLALGEPPESGGRAERGQPGGWRLPPKRPATSRDEFRIGAPASCRGPSAALQRRIVSSSLSSREWRISRQAPVGWGRR